MGRAGCCLSINATAILLVEPCFFDIGKEKAAQKVADRASSQKFPESGQLQPVLAKCRTGTVQKPTTIEVPGSQDWSKVDKEMDDFINAGECPEKCLRLITNIHFENINLHI